MSGLAFLKVKTYRSDRVFAVTVLGRAEHNTPDAKPSIDTAVPKETAGFCSSSVLK